MDRSHYVNCELQLHNDDGALVHTYWVRRYYPITVVIDDVNENDYCVFGAALRRNVLGDAVPNNYNNVRLPDNWIAKVECKCGGIGMIETREGYLQCGIGTMLSYICMQDTDVMGDTEYKHMDIGYAIGYNINRYEDGHNGMNIPLKNCIRNNCYRVVFLSNIADPPRATRAYLNAAKEAAFNYLITMLYDDEPDELSIVTIDNALQMQTETNDIWSDSDLFFCKANKANADFDDC